MESGLIPSPYSESQERAGEKNSSFALSDSRFFGGLGLRPDHYSHLQNNKPQTAKWFEVISENFMDSEGKPLSRLLEFRKNFPIALHGVSLGIGGPDAINFSYLLQLKKLIEKVNPIIVSDHLCWSAVGGHSSHDLLPLPYTQTTLDRILDKLDQVQNYLGREILLENPSAYLQFQESTFAESDFLALIAKKSGCGILLDINNVYVSCQNFSWDAKKYLDAIPNSSVGQIHLAGFTDKGKYLFDTHSAPVDKNVWELYQYKTQNMQRVPVMIEWDDHIPDFTAYENELKIAETLWNEGHDRQRKTEISAIL